jgi:hypothetical protein
MSQERGDGARDLDEKKNKTKVGEFYCAPWRDWIQSIYGCFYVLLTRVTSEFQKAIGPEPIWHGAMVVP